MKRVLNSVILVSLVLLAFSCVSTSIPFEKTVEGHKLDSPVKVAALRSAIMLSLPKYNWQITDEGEGWVDARFSKSQGVIVADIRVDYGEEGYSITYIDSKELDADPEAMTIHKNYVRWINNLRKDIFLKYTQLILE